MVAIINLSKLGGAGDQQCHGARRVEEAGVSVAAPRLRSSRAECFAGARAKWIAGAGITKRFVGAQIGEKIKFGGDVLWTVVGAVRRRRQRLRFRIVGRFESDRRRLPGARRSTVTVRMKDPGGSCRCRARLRRDNRLQYFVAKREEEVFRRTVGDEWRPSFASSASSSPVIFSTGSTIGAMITMYGSVANRTTEIGTFEDVRFASSAVFSWRF